MEKAEQTIVIRRIKKGGDGAHGGAWKIALADFALALMAFFLVLWLIETTTELEKATIAGYFSDPRSIADAGDGGTPYVLDLQGKPLDIANQGLNLALVREDQEQAVESPADLENPEYIELARLRQIEILEGLKGELEAEIGGNQEFEWVSDSLNMEVTEDGLKIEIIDRENRPLFDSGSTELHVYARQIMWAMGRILNTVPNRLNVIGHTDSAPFSSAAEYTNWELSADRANAARRALLDGGLIPGKVAQVIGMGDSVPFNQDNPLDPANRRIVILVMNNLAEQRLQRETGRSERSGVLDTEVLPRSEPLELF